MEEMEVVVYKRKTDQPNIFDEIQNKLVDIVSIFLRLSLQVSENRVRCEDIEKKIDILKVRASQQEEKIITLNSSLEIANNHMRHALKDVTAMQLDLG